MKRKIWTVAAIAAAVKARHVRGNDIIRSGQYDLEVKQLF